MQATVRLRDTGAWVRRGPATVSGARSVLMRYRLELLWAVFVAANYAAMFLWSKWETIPFYLIWISLTLLYGLRVWPLRPTLTLLTAVMLLTALPIATQVMGSTDPVDRVMRVPLMAMLFLAVVWHARRRVEALRIAESRAEELRSTLERQERFIHDASHELRTPVTIARGHLELLRTETGASAEVDVALDELGRMDAIVARLLVLAVADEPDFLQPAQIDLEPLLEDVFMRWSELAPRVWRLGPLASGRLLVDADRLRAALDALLENAVKYSLPGAAIELRAEARDGGELCIEVADEGCGVPPEALSRIFDRFGRADSARTRAAGGVGLGLAITDAIAKAHGGGCSVTSTGGGSSFALHLPNFTPAARPRVAVATNGAGHARTRAAGP